MKRLLLIITICISSVSFGQVPSYVPSDGLVGWWPFNGNANDESLNGNNGTVSGPALTDDRFGNPNSAYDFDGISDQISVSNNPSLNFESSNSFTLSYWIKPSFINLGSVAIIVNKQIGHGGGQDGWNSNIELNASSNFRISNGSGSTCTVGTSQLIANNYYHIVHLYNGSIGLIYINGELMSQVSCASGSIGDNASNMLFGHPTWNAAPAIPYNGIIDDVGIWIRALTQCEIRNLYTSGAPSVSVFNDLDENCVQESELGVEGVNVSITPGNYIATTESSGIASFPSLSDGTYTATIDTTNLNWSPTCPITQTFTIINGITDCIGFGLINDNPCTDPDVSIFAPSLRRCFSNRLVYVSACNQITATGILDSSYVDVELDPLLMVDGASLPYTDLGNNTFRFETGDIYPGQCVNFTLSTTVSCDAQNGQTLCMDATLYPAEDCIFDSIPSDPITNDGIGGTLDGLPGPCTLPWDKSSLQVDGWCQGDSVYFSVTNTGDFGDGDMECYSPVWLTVDGVVTDTDSLQIQGGETVIYSYPASGQTFFLNAEQHPLHPGNSHPNAHVELCGDSTNWTPGVVNQFPQDDADPDVDIYCGQVTAP